MGGSTPFPDVEVASVVKVTLVGCVPQVDCWGRDIGRCSENKAIDCPGCEHEANIELHDQLFLRKLEIESN